MRQTPIRTARLHVDAEDGYCVVSDDEALCYGDGPTLYDAIRDLLVALDELRDLEAADRPRTADHLEREVL